MKTSKSIAFILVFLLVGLSACKKENTKSTATSVTGNWNLPDKELRYLRTVIVTAAIHRCLSRGLLLR